MAAKLEIIAQNAITIDTGVQMPAGGFAGGRARYPWHEMEIGDSFAVPADARRFSNLAHITGKRLGRRFSVRRIDGGYRCWRVA